MDIQFVRILFIILVIVLTGCASKSNSELNHTLSNFNIVQNESSVEESIDSIWDKLNSELLSYSEKYSEFEIITVDEESHIIQASFYSLTPYQYVNCGFYETTYPKQNDDPKVYIQTITGNSSNQQQSFMVEDLDSIDSFLEATVNISLSEVEGGTSALVDIQYNLSIIVRSKINILDSSGGKIKEEEFLFQDECRFTTLMNNRCNKIDEITCSSKGTLEKIILDLVEH